MEYRRRNAVLPALGKMKPWWLRVGKHRDLRKRVLVSFRLKDTIRAIDSDCYGQDGELKDSVDQDRKLWKSLMRVHLGSYEAMEAELARYDQH
jgi:hypothetical protein